MLTEEVCLNYLSVLKVGTRPVGRQRLGFRDVIKRDLKDFAVDRNQCIEN